jgi:predicted Zn-dependent peptidase
MLNDELRVNSGLTYGASSRFNALKMEVHLQSARSQPKTTEPAIDKALEVLNKLHKNGIDEKSLASAKNYVKDSFPTIRNYRTTSQLDTNVLV